jgi:hypothetical protein
MIGGKMKLQVRRPALGILLAATLAAVTGCPAPVGSGSPPTFAGLSTVTAVSLTQALLTWTAATDDKTASADIVYEIWMASLSNVPTNASPAFTTSPGATSFTATGLPGLQTTYFVVKAKDSDGNLDSNTTVKSVTTPASTAWNLVDGGQASTGLGNGFAVVNPSAAVVGGKLYVMWFENNPSLCARVSVFNGNDSAPSWTNLDPGTTGGINHDTSMQAGQSNGTSDLMAFNSRLYATWSEFNGTAFQIRVAMYSPTNPGWTFVDGNAANGLNHAPAQSAIQPSLVVLGGSLYLAWEESDGTTYQVRVDRYNGNDSSPAWTSIDGNGPEGINYSSASNASALAVTPFGGRIVAAWDENAQVRVQSYDGNSWSPADQGGLNYAPGNAASRISLASAAGNLYAAWDEYDVVRSHTLIRARVFNGSFSSSGWSFVDGGGDAGLNFDPSMAANLPSLTELNGGLVITFGEFNSLTEQIRARAFNGNLGSPAWQTIDGGSSNGLNHDPIYQALAPFAVSFGGKLYITWVEASGITQNQTRVIRGM